MEAQLPLLSDVAQEVIDTWQALSRSMLQAPVFVTPEWVLSHAEHWDNELSIMHVRDASSQVIGLLPMTWRRFWKLAVLVVAGDPQSDRVATLVRELSSRPMIIRAFLNFACYRPGAWDLMWLGPLEQVEASEWLSEAHGIGLTSFATLLDSPVLGLPATWADYLGSLPSKRRKAIRRGLRVVERDPALSLWQPESEDDVALGVRQTLQLHYARLSEKGSIFSSRVTRDSHFADFLGDFCLNAYREGWLLLAQLRRDDCPVAAGLCFAFQDSVHLYLSAFDSAYRYLSPGGILNSWIIGEAIRRSHVWFDFGRGGEGYKYQFGAHPRILSYVCIAAPTTRSRWLCWCLQKWKGLGAILGSRFWNVHN